MSIALVDQLNFEKQMPIDGNCFQEMAVVVPITGASTYNAGSYFIINIPRSGPNCVFDPANSFCGSVYQTLIIKISHQITVLTVLSAQSMWYTPEIC